MRGILILFMILGLTGCHIQEELEQVGKAPAFSPASDVFTAKDKKGAPLVKSGVARASSHQALWASGKKSFFMDQRARSVGDILTVNVDIKDEKGKLDNKTNRSRSSQRSLSIPQFFGIKDADIIGANPAMAFTDTTDPSFEGHGKVDRSETVRTKISVVVQEVQPNGNLRIEGKQEVRVNYDVREIFISGIVRPQDIDDSNEISWSRIAEARIGYGGRGQIMQFQQPPYGQQILDILLPI